MTLDIFERLTAKWLLHQSEVALGERCDRLDDFTDDALADQFLIAWSRPAPRVRLRAPRASSSIHWNRSCARDSFFSTWLGSPSSLAAASNSPCVKEHCPAIDHSCRSMRSIAYVA